MAVLLRDIIANGLCVVNVKRSESESESKYRPVAQISLSLICPPGLLLVGVATPNPPEDRGRFSVFVSYDLKYFSTIPLVVPVRRLSCLTETPFS